MWDETSNLIWLILLTYGNIHISLIQGNTNTFPHWLIMVTPTWVPGVAAAACAGSVGLVILLVFSSHKTPRRNRFLSTWRKKTQPHYGLNSILTLWLVSEMVSKRCVECRYVWRLNRTKREGVLLCLSTSIFFDYHYAYL